MLKFEIAAICDVIFDISGVICDSLACENSILKGRLLSVLVDDGRFS